MVTESASVKRCPLCGGELREEMTTVPFVVKGSVVVVKRVKGEVCSDCGEAFLSGRVTDAVTALVQDALRQRMEVAVVTLSDPEPLPA